MVHIAVQCAGGFTVCMRANMIPLFLLVLVTHSLSGQEQEDPFLRACEVSSQQNTMLLQDDVDELFNACEKNNIESARALLEKNPALVYARDSNYTPLMSAAEHNAEDIVKLLLDKRADVDAHNHVNRTALHYAAKNGHAGVAMVLLAHGADSNARCDYGSTSLHYAAGSIYCRAKRSHVDVARMLLASKALLEARDHSGYTPLHNAALYANVAMAAFLLLQGADQCAKNNSGESLVQQAFTKHLIEYPLLIKLFMVAGSEIVPYGSHNVLCRNGESSMCGRCGRDGRMKNITTEIHAELEEKHGEFVDYLTVPLWMMPKPLHRIIAEYYTFDHLMLPHVAHQIFAQQLWHEQILPPLSLHNKRQKQE